MLIKIDIDGVLRNILEPMCKLYNDEFGTEITPDEVDRYRVDEMFPLIKEVYNKSAVEFFFDTNSFLFSEWRQNIRVFQKLLINLGS